MWKHEKIKYELLHKEWKNLKKKHGSNIEST